MKKKLSTILLGALSVFTAITTVTSAIAWFVPKGTIEKSYNLIEGETDGAYFAYGNGKPSTGPNDDENRPYGIRTARHLYNLAWLQYLGYFKNQMYFELADNIDMTGWTLPPIGTPGNPFVGLFDGQGYVISNLTVSNDFQNDLVKHPPIVNTSVFNSGDNPATADVTETNNYPNIVGFFGVVGNYQNNYTGTYSSSINKMINYGLVGVSVKTVASETLIGIAAGYVDATVENVAVDSAHINVQAGADAISNGPTDNISDYSIIGYSKNPKKVKRIDEEVYSVNVSKLDDFNVESSGDGIGWGGSINMYDLYNRILAVKTNSASNNGNGRNGFSNKSKNYQYRSYWTSDPDHNETENQNVDASQTTTGTNTYLSYYDADTSKQDFGTYSQYNRTDTDQFLYLMGGQNKVTTFEEYYISTQITDGNGNFMHAQNPANNRRITNTTNQNTAIGWVIPSTSTGKVYTVYNQTKYYLSADATGLLLRTGENNGLDWTRSDSSDGTKIRLTNNGRYIDFNNGWKLTNMPEPPGNIGVEPPNPDQPDYWDADEKFATGSSGWQVGYYVNQDTTFYMRDVFFEDADSGIFIWVTAGTSFMAGIDTYTDGWTFSNFGNNRTNKVRNGNNYLQLVIERTVTLGFIYSFTTKLYFGPLGTNSNNITYVSDWTMSGSNDTYTLSAVGKSGTSIGGSGTNTTYYLVPQIGSDGTCVFLLSTTRTSLNFKSNQAIVDEHNDPIEQEYEEIKRIHDDWVQSTIDYDDDYQDYLSDLNNTYTIHFDVDNIVRGPDRYTDLNNPSGDKMVYSGYNTSYIPLNVKADGAFTNMDNYRPQTTNTGYIVGGSKLNSNSSFGMGAAGIRVAYYSKSTYLSDDSYYYRTNLIANVYTIDNGGVRPIVENPNNTETYDPNKSEFKKYSRSFYDFQTKLRDGGNNIYGLHFDDSYISMKDIVVAPRVQISNTLNANSDNKQFTNFELPVNSIDFSLRDKGYINFFAGSYFASNNVEDIVNSFFSIHQVIRDFQTKEIIAIKEIQAIYSDGEDLHSYIIQYKDAPIQFSKPYIYKDGVKYILNPAGEDYQTYEPRDVHIETSTMSASEYRNYITNYNYKMVFNTDWITNFSDDPATGSHSLVHDLSQKQDRLFYFEIPTNEGEYCLGAVPGGLGAYLLYLDIGANASKTQRTTVYEHFDTLEKSYVYPGGVAFVEMPTDPSDYTSKTKYISEYDYDNKTFVTDRDIDVIDENSVCMEINVGFSGDFTIKRTGDDVALNRATNSLPSCVATYQGNEVDSFVAVLNGNTTEFEIEADVSTSREIVRLSYYDYSVYLEDWTLTVITDVKENGGSWNRSVAQYLHYGTNNQIDYDEEDEYKYMRIYATPEPGQTAKAYQVDAVQDYYEFLDQNVLVISSNDYDSVNKLIVFSLEQDISNDEVYLLVPHGIYSVDINTSLGTNYYNFDGYWLEFISNSEELNILIIDVATGNMYKTIYLGEIVQGQEITIADRNRTITIYP